MLKFCLERRPVSIGQFDFSTPAAGQRSATDKWLIAGFTRLRVTPAGRDDSSQGFELHQRELPFMK